MLVANMLKHTKLSVLLSIAFRGIGEIGGLYVADIIAHSVGHSGPKVGILTQELRFETL